jgi:hypothetical protein
MIFKIFRGACAPLVILQLCPYREGKRRRAAMAVDVSEVNGGSRILIEGMPQQKFYMLFGKVHFSQLLNN